MNSISFDITTLQEGYASNAFTVTDLIREALRRINSGDSKIWITLDAEAKLLATAARLDSQGDKSLPLYGIPFAVNDNIDVDNLPTTAACPDYKYFPTEDSTVVAQLRAAGAIPIGKTNLDQFATGLTGTHTPYGVPGNAFDPDYIPGGSSSGSAVSVALGQVSFSLGTDTAGSGRIPAGFNNLVGLKPSRGALSTTGLIPACKSLDCISIFALNAADAQAAYHVAATYDATDPYSRKIPQDLANPRRAYREGMTFGVPSPLQLKFFGNEEYQTLFLQAVKRLESLGFIGKVIDIQPMLTAGHLFDQGPWVAERYWAIQNLIKESPDSLLPTTRAFIEKGIQATAVDVFDAYYKLQTCKQKADAIWEHIDFLVTPTAGTHYTIAEVEANPIELNSNLGYYTNFMNLLDLSAVATPTGFTSKTKTPLPFGITLIGEAFDDEKLLTIANRLQEASDLPLGTSQEKKYPPLKRAPIATQPIVVYGAHLSGLPLNHQLTNLGATLNRTTTTSPHYRLFALPGTTPPKPGMIRDPENGAAIEVEIWDLPETQWAAFIAGIPSPLGIGNVELADGTTVKGFSCETWALEGAQEVTSLGGWRSYIAQKD